MTDFPVKRRRKLIEVAIPLEAMSEASAKEKSVRHGHPSTFHLWWSRKPTSMARAVLFCQLVDDPSDIQEEFPTQQSQELERIRLFHLISRLARWESINDPELLRDATKEINKSWKRYCIDNDSLNKDLSGENLPPVYDPFAGGGTIPMEAQRLGLGAFSSDLNPLAVLINKAMLEIPPLLKNQPSVSQDNQGSTLTCDTGNNYCGLVSDIRHYGSKLRSRAFDLVGSNYPTIHVTRKDAENRPELDKYIGQDLRVIAWLWVRTVESPNPSFAGNHVPLAPKFWLSKKPGNEYYLEPIVEESSYHFNIRKGLPEDLSVANNGTKLSRGANFKCILSGSPIEPSYIKKKGKERKIGSRLLAIVAEGKRERVFLKASQEHEDLAVNLPLPDGPRTEISGSSQYLGVKPYGMNTFDSLFTNRQLISLNAFTSLIPEVGRQVEEDALKAGMSSDPKSLSEGGSGAKAYAGAIQLYLGIALSRLTDISNALCHWEVTKTQVRHLFGRQAIPMMWDYAENNVFGEAAGDYLVSLENMVKAMERLPKASFPVQCSLLSAQDQCISSGAIVSTDPPYFDMVPYADLSDFFYVWLRKSIGHILPDLFVTMATPKMQELVAFAHRHGGKKRDAEQFFMEGMTNALAKVSHSIHPAFPCTIYYAFKQVELNLDGSVARTGWEAFLEAVIKAGFEISGTWPLRTELSNRLRSQGSNALASSILLVCEKRDSTSAVISRSDFRRFLRLKIARSILDLERCNTAPVDIAQSVIGPGMSIFSKHSAVLNPDDTAMSVGDALKEINSALDECLSQGEGNLDADSLFAITFFESYGYSERDFGDAENLAKARNVSVAGVSQAGILRSVAGKVRLLRRSELEDEWNPENDPRLCIWEATQQLIRRLESNGEVSAALLLSYLNQLPGHIDLIVNCRDLAYRLYNHCEKTKQTEEARAYNGLVIAWPELQRLAASQASQSAVQTSLI